MDLSYYSYDLPEGQIARVPASPRDHSKLMVVDTKQQKIHFDRFFNLDKYLPPKSLLILNETRVVPARLHVTKSTSGKVELLLLMNEWTGGPTLEALSNKRLHLQEVLSLKTMPLFKVVGQNESRFKLELLVPNETLQELLWAHGEMPIPKYIGRHLPEAQLRKKYQTVFSKNEGSVAAPTASLHFTERVLNKLAKAGVERSPITLHVGMGTFAPLREDQLQSRTLHSEIYEIPTQTLKALAKAHKNDQTIVAVGTTSVRTLESYGKTGESAGSTQILIAPPHDFKHVDALITNFHLPESSLMMLVQAFLDHKQAPWPLTELYKGAIEQDFRFYSFGDSMLII